MLNVKDVREILKIGAILFLITAVSAGILAFVNKMTSPVIEANALKKQNEAMQRVLPDAEAFEEIDMEFNDTSVVALYSGAEAGYVALCEPKGYGGAVCLAVGVDPEGKVSGIDITSQGETPGLGANCTKEEFKEQYKGKTTGIEVVKRGAKDNQIDAISSATITTKAVTKGVNDALSVIAGLEADK